jgi:hypothetical protein
MEQMITGFHQDDAADWVAELACGHFQHVRHNPPWVRRPWTATEERRNEMVGVKLNCKKCDSGAPPDTAGASIGSSAGPRSRGAAFVSALLVSGALVAGAATHFFIFGYAYFGSRWMWAAMALRSVLALVAGGIWRRCRLPGAVLWLAFLGIECGPLLMGVWALVNFSATGKIGFNAAYWILPSVLDLVALLAGARRRIRSNGKEEITEGGD